MVTVAVDPATRVADLLRHGSRYDLEDTERWRRTRLQRLASARPADES
jgi:hypothetical protein